MSHIGETPTQEKWHPSDAFPPLAALLVASIVMSYAFGAIKQSHALEGPFSFTRLMATIGGTSLYTLLPVVSMFVLSMMVGWINRSANAQRSYRDGLAAAWFFVLASNITFAFTPDPVDHLPRPHVRSVFE